MLTDDELAAAICKAHEEFTTRGYIVGKTRASHTVVYRTSALKSRADPTLILSLDETVAIEKGVSDLYRKFVVNDRGVKGAAMCRHYILLPMLLLQIDPNRPK